MVLRDSLHNQNGSCPNLQMGSASFRLLVHNGTMCSDVHCECRLLVGNCFLCSCLLKPFFSAERNIPISPSFHSIVVLDLTFFQLALMHVPMSRLCQLLPWVLNKLMLEGFVPEAPICSSNLGRR